MRGRPRATAAARSDVRVTAIVVMWNSERYVQGCLVALLAQEHPLDLIVVDNASHDASIAIATAIAARHPGRMRVIRSAVNSGFSGGVNLGIDAAPSADAVLLCNPDVRLEPDHVALLVAALEADAGIGSVQGTLWRPSRSGLPDVIDSTGHRAFRTRLFDNRDEGRTVPSAGGEVFGVTGAAALHRRAMLDDIAIPRPDGTLEWLDETLFAYYDDVDVDWRARLRGWRAVHVPTAAGRHVRSGAAAGRSEFVEELNAANRLLLIAKLDDRRGLAAAAPGVLLATVLKLIWLGVTTPAVIGRVVRRVRVGWAPTRRRRALVLARATTKPATVVAGFERFDWRSWVARWWSRARGHAT
jgi:GT2 family glycosyltransferase